MLPNAYNYATAPTEIGFLKLRLFSIQKDRLSKEKAALGYRWCACCTTKMWI